MKSWIMMIFMPIICITDHAFVQTTADVTASSIYENGVLNKCEARHLREDGGGAGKGVKVVQSTA